MFPRYFKLFIIETYNLHFYTYLLFPEDYCFDLLIKDFHVKKNLLFSKCLKNAFANNSNHLLTANGL